MKTKGFSLRVLFAASSLISFQGCVSFEWRGGMTPSLKWEGLSKDKDRFAETNTDQPKTIFRLSGNATAEDWPDFRGKGRLGIAPEQGVELDWKQEAEPIWRKPVGAGHASIIVVRSKVFTLEQSEELEILSCRSLKTGELIWQYEQQEKWSDSMGGAGPRTTPLYDSGSIFLFSSGGTLISVDAESGKMIWERRAIDADYDFPHWGIACSPLIVDDAVVVSPGGNSSAVKAFHAKTGKTLWNSDLQGKGVYLSPSLLKLSGENYLIAGVEGKLAGLDPESGKTIWEHPWKIFMNNAQITQPLKLTDDAFLLSAGYGKGASAIRLRRTSTGFETEEVWKSKNLKTKFSNPILVDGHLYGLSESLLTCLDAETGELKWRGKKYGYGRVLLAQDKLLILGNTGMLSIVKATPDTFEEVASHQVLSKERCWNGPALVGGYLVVRNGSEIACYDFAKR